MPDAFATFGGQIMTHR